MWCFVPKCPFNPSIVPGTYRNETQHWKIRSFKMFQHDLPLATPKQFQKLNSNLKQAEKCKIRLCVRIFLCVCVFFSFGGGGWRYPTLKMMILSRKSWRRSLSICAWLTWLLKHKEAPYCARAIYRVYSWWGYKPANITGRHNWEAPSCIFMYFLSCFQFCPPVLWMMSAPHSPARLTRVVGIGFCRPGVRGSVSRRFQAHRTFGQKLGRF